MRKRRFDSLDALVSGRMDGALREDQELHLNKLLAADPEAAARAAELETARATLRALPPLREDETYWLRLQERLEAHKARPPRLFPALPQRAIPAVTAVVSLLLVTLAVFLYLQRGELAQYVSKKSETVQLAYEQTLGGNWFMPLFEKTDKDRVLQFAMFGTLHIDEQHDAVLRVDKRAQQGFRIELGRDRAPAVRAIKVEELYRQVRATPAQRRIMDTVLLFAQRRLESAVLLGRNEDVVIDPAITQLHTTILSTLASSLEPAQRERLDRFLDANNSAFTLASFAPVPPPPPPELYQRLRPASPPKTFVRLGDGSVDMIPLAINLDSIRERMAGMPEQMPSIAVRVEDYRKRYKYEIQEARSGARATNITRLENLEREYDEAARQYQSTGQAMQRHAEILLHRVIAAPEDEMITILLEQPEPTAPGDTRVTVRARESRTTAASRAHQPRLPRSMQFRVIRGSGAKNVDVTIDVDSLVEDGLRGAPEMRLIWNQAQPKLDMLHKLLPNDSLLRQLHDLEGRRLRIEEHWIEQTEPNGGTRKGARVIVRETPEPPPAPAPPADSLSISDPPRRIPRVYEREVR